MWPKLPDTNRGISRSQSVKLQSHRIEIYQNTLTYLPIEPFLLNPLELKRADSFVFDRDRERFIAGRSWLRRTLAGALQIDPRSVPLTTNKFGKPVLLGPEMPLHFNLTHTSDAIVLAIADSPVGIDLETDQATITEGMGKIVMSEAELNLFRAKPTNEHQMMLLALWTRKEAALKAAGCGMLYDPTHITVGFGGEDQQSNQVTIPDLAADKPTTHTYALATYRVRNSATLSISIQEHM